MLGKRMKTRIFALSALALSCSMAHAQEAALDYLGAQVVEGARFWGYGRGGTGTSTDKVLGLRSDLANNGFNIIETAGNPHAQTGRLGNEGNFAEFHIDYGLVLNDMNWVIKTNIATDMEKFNLDEWWVAGQGVFKSNPGAVIWVGKRYYQRYKAEILDYHMLQNDGVGAGIDDWDFGFAKFNLGITKQENGDSYGQDFCSINDPTYACDSSGRSGYRGGYHSVNTRLHGMKITDNIAAGLFFNYGFYAGSDTTLSENGSMTAKDMNPNSYQAGFQIKQGQWADFNEFVVRYSSDIGKSMTQDWLDTPSTQIGAFFQGMQELGDSFRLQYALVYEGQKFDDEALKRNLVSIDKSDWGNITIRPTYIWDDRFSTDLELSYDQIKLNAREGYGESGTNSSYKVTLSQNVHIGGTFWDRPVLRFFVTYGQSDTQTTVYNNRHGEGVDNPSWEWRHNPYVTEKGKNSATTVGAQFETWW
jgi:maltoporin